MNKKLLSIALIGCIAFILSSWTPFQVPVQKTIVVEDQWNDSYPIDGIYFNDCTGEFVEYTGTINDMGTLIIYDDGTGHANFHYNYVAVTGIGETSGDIYHLTGAGVLNNNFISADELTFLQNGNVTIQGIGVVSHFKFHAYYTINANGDLTRDGFDLSFECL